MKEIIQRVQTEVMRALARARADARMGIVKSYDPDTHKAVVNIMPEDVPTGWLPILPAWTGNGFGAYFGLMPGDQVLVVHLEGDAGSGLIVGRVNDNDHRPPSVPADEAWIVHQSGAFIKLTNDGKVLINGTVEIDVGNLGNAVHKLVTDAMVALFNNHTHPGVQAGSASTGAPNQTMGNDQLTAILKAN